MISLKKARRPLQQLLLLAVLLAIGWYLYSNIDQLASKPVDVDFRYLGVAMVLTIAGHLSSLMIWTRIATSFDMQTSILHAGKTWFLSRLAHYLPGKVAIFLIRFSGYANHSKTKVSTATIFEFYTTLCALGILLLTTVFFATNFGAYPKLASISLMLILVAISHPNMIRFALALVRKLLPIPDLNALPGQMQTFGFTIGQLSTMMLHGGALFMTFNAVGHVDSGHYLIVTAMFFLAGVIGMISVFAPSGIGVREAALFAGLSSHIDLTTLVVGAILIRLIGIASEAVLTCIFIAFKNPRQS